MQYILKAISEDKFFSFRQPSRFVMKMRFWLPLQFTLYFVHVVAPRLSGFLLAPFENISIKFFAISDECWKQYKNKVKDQRGLSLKTLSFKDVKQSSCRMVPRQILWLLFYEAVKNEQYNIIFIGNKL